MMDIDILDGKTWDNGIFERMRWLRENAPVYRDEKNKLWVLSKYEDVAYVSKNNKIFCSGEGVRPNLPMKISIIDMDEPRHAQLRGLVNRGFTPRMVGRLETVFRGITTTAIDGSGLTLPSHPACSAEVEEVVASGSTEK